MQKINIEITKAQIKSYDVSFPQDWWTPNVSVSVGLFTANWKEISTFNISTSSRSDNKFDLEPSILEPIYWVAKHLEAVATRHCSASIWILPQNVEAKKAEEDKKRADAILSDGIPF